MALSSDEELIAFRPRDGTVQLSNTRDIRLAFTLDFNSVSMTNLSIYVHSLVGKNTILGPENRNTS